MLKQVPLLMAKRRRGERERKIIKLTLINAVNTKHNYFFNALRLGTDEAEKMRNGNDKNR